jgi:hypothetical protein
MIFKGHFPMMVWESTYTYLKMVFCQKMIETSLKAVIFLLLSALVYTNSMSSSSASSTASSTASAPSSDI